MKELHVDLRRVQEKAVATVGKRMKNLYGIINLGLDGIFWELWKKIYMVTAANLSFDFKIRRLIRNISHNGIFVHSFTKPAIT